MSTIPPTGGVDLPVDAARVQVEILDPAGIVVRTLELGKSGAGVRTVGLAAPLRYIHSPSSVAAKCDLNCVLELAREFLERIGKED